MGFGALASAALERDLPFEQRDGRLEVRLPRLDLLDLLLLLR